MNEQSVKSPSLMIALIPIIFLGVVLSYAILVFDESPHVPLVLATIVTCLIAGKLGHKWPDMEKYIINSIKISMQAILILLSIGMLIGVWIAAGVVPTMIYYGLEIINPSIFLVASLIVCSIVSVATSSSWATCGTVGVALFGIGSGLGIPQPLVVGSIISGAYFGDKMSPLSDTTNLAPAVVGNTTLFEHIRHLVYSTGIAWTLAAIIFGVLGMRYSAGDVNIELIDTMLYSISENFNISPVLLLPPVLVVGMVALKVPPLPGIICGALIAVVMGIIFQASFYDGINEVVGVMLSSAQAGFVADTGNEYIDNLFTNGGIEGMLWTVSLIICAMAFGSMMEKSGCIEKIAASLLAFAKSTGSLVAVSLFSCFFVNIATSDQYLAIVLPGRMYKDEYIKRGLHPKNLARCCEDGGTVTSPLVPWNTCGAYMYGVFGISAFVYAPYCFFNLICPVVNLILGITGITMEKIDKDTFIPDSAATL